MQRGSARKADGVSLGYSLNNVRNVNSDGTLNNNNAYNGNNGVRPASVEFTATK